MIGNQFKFVTSKSSGQKNFTIVSMLGEGSFGNVYLVKDQKNKRFALKQIWIDPFNIQESQKQIQIMKKLSHQNLVKIYDCQVEIEKQTVYILMEYCEGGDLLNYYKTKKKQLSVREILKIYKQIIQAFISMNIKGVFHRDLKPENIFIAKGHLIKIGDFGCARSMAYQDITKIKDHSLSKGTPIYSSPQQLMNEKYSSKCDVWASGVLLYFLYFNYHPFIDTVAHNIIEKIRDRTEGKQISLPADCDSTIARMIKLTLVYEDRQRASWRQLWLSRLFCDKIQNVRSYVEYLHNLSQISYTIIKMLWVARKYFQISKIKDQVFIYFFIKFQCTVMLLANQINCRDNKHSYLFVQQSYQSYQLDQQFIDEIRKDYKDRQKFFKLIKKSIQTTQANKQIQLKQTKRVSAFCDLDFTLKYGYYILLEIKEKIDNQNKNQKSQLDYKVWTYLAKWVNFQKWFSFQKQPTIKKVLEEAENIVDPKKFILDEIQRYESGDVV